MVKLGGAHLSFAKLTRNDCHLSHTSLKVSYLCFYINDELCRGKGVYGK